MNDNIVIQRLKEFMLAQGINRNKLAKDTGCSAPAVNDYLENGKSIGKIIHRVIEVYPQLSTEWLFRGMGEMILNDEPVVIETSPEISPEDYLKLKMQDDIHKKMIEDLECKVAELTKQNAILEYLNSQKQ